MNLPAAVLALAHAIDQLGPNPPTVLTFRQDGNQWVVIFEDGRKLRTPVSDPDRIPWVEPKPTKKRRSNASLPKVP